MGEAFLTRKGGAVLRELTIISPPTKLSYFQGDTLNMDGTVVGAKFGSFVIPLHESAWTYAPKRPLIPSDKSVTITATVGRQTKTINIPIVVEAFCAVLGDNTWAQIANAAASGIAKSLWHVGDIKYETINGASVGCRIIGFDADPLHKTDARYGDASYNSGKNKAAITFQYTYNNRRSYMNYSGDNVGGWDQSDMRITKMPAEKALCPTEMQAVMRTVSKYTSPGNYGSSYASRVVESCDVMFLLAAQEVYGNLGSNTVGSAEKNYTTQYAWYSEGHDFRKNTTYDEWLRSPHDPAGCNSKSDFAKIQASNGQLYIWGTANSSLAYYPAFCV
ncbi:MAG: hypothetical protein ACI4WX_12850 [Aristaeellaceae bacterium]